MKFTVTYQHEKDSPTLQFVLDNNETEEEVVQHLYYTRRHKIDEWYYTIDLNSCYRFKIEKAD